jgi:hypothetical protein
LVRYQVQVKKAPVAAAIANPVIQQVTAAADSSEPEKKPFVFNGALNSIEAMKKAQEAAAAAKNQATPATATSVSYTDPVAEVVKTGQSVSLGPTEATTTETPGAAIEKTPEQLIEEEIAAE